MTTTSWRGAGLGELALRMLSGGALLGPLSEFAVGAEFGRRYQEEVLDRQEDRAFAWYEALEAGALSEAALEVALVVGLAGNVLKPYPLSLWQGGMWVEVAGLTRVLRLLAQNGYARLLARLQPDFGWTAAEARACFECACTARGLDAAKWLAGTFGLSAADVRANDYRVLQKTCRRRQVVAASWLVAEFGLDGDNIYAARIPALAAAAGDQAMHNWLRDRFKIDAKLWRDAPDDTLWSDDDADGGMYDGDSVGADSADGDGADAGGFGAGVANDDADRVGGGNDGTDIDTDDDLPVLTNIG